MSESIKRTPIAPLIWLRDDSMLMAILAELQRRGLASSQELQSAFSPGYKPYSTTWYGAKQEFVAILTHMRDRGLIIANDARLAEVFSFTSGKPHMSVASIRSCRATRYQGARVRAIKDYIETLIAALT